MQTSNELKWIESNERYRDWYRTNVGLSISSQNIQKKKKSEEEKRSWTEKFGSKRNEDTIAHTQHLQRSFAIRCVTEAEKMKEVEISITLSAVDFVIFLLHCHLRYLRFQMSRAQYVHAANECFRSQRQSLWCFVLVNANRQVRLIANAKTNK